MRTPLTTAALALTLAAPALAIDIDTVEVANPGNAADPRPSAVGNASANLGAVNQTYRIGTFEVTNAQYAQFLNAKATLGDPSGLYNPEMATSPQGGIVRTGSGTVADPFAYQTRTANAADYAQRPVTFVSFYDAIRFANWMHNGRGDGSTETGSYTLPTTDPVPTNGDSITRNPNATWVLPSEDEWYKAAYHQPADRGGDADDYWSYALRTNSIAAFYSDEPPGDDAPDPTRVANFRKDDGRNNGYDDGTAINPGGGVAGLFNQLHVTPVGGYTQSTTFYGTFDQNGNVNEWTDTLIDNGNYTQRVVEGGSWIKFSGSLAASFRSEPDTPDTETIDVGFRLALVPEPASALLLLPALAPLLTRRR